VKRSKDLKVFAFPQNNGYVPSIRVAGKWLAEMGFAYGDRVKLTAENGEITIRKQHLKEEKPVMVSLCGKSHQERRHIRASR
jgi:hypothetical protein